MRFNWKKKVLSLITALTVLLTVLPVLPVFAAQDNIEIILTDVTASDETTLSGEAKIKVSVKGAGGNVSIAQIALTFSGDLKYKSIEFLQGENSPETGSTFVTPNAALANSTQELTPSIISMGTPLEFTDDATDLFILTFAGDPGKEVSVSLDKDSNTYCTVDTKDIKPASDASASAKSSETANEGKSAVVRLAMDKITDFPASGSTGSKSSSLQLIITSENDSGYSISTIIGSEHYQNETTPTFEITNTVLADHTYTVEISGIGYKTYTVSGVTFDEKLNVTNSELIAGDVDGDGDVDSDDKKLCQDLIAEKGYSEAADFNRDGKTNSWDMVAFEGIPDKEPESGDNTGGDNTGDGGIEDGGDIGGGDNTGDDSEDKVATVPAKINTPTVTGGNKRITAAWKAPDDGGSPITGYILRYGTNASNLTKEIKLSANSTDDTITGLTADTLYHVSVAAVNAVGTGKFSDIGSAKTDAASNEGGGGSGGGGGGGGGGSTSYNVVYSIGAGTLVSGNLSEKVDKGDSPATPPSITPPEGKVFKGWSTDGKTVITLSSLSITGNIILTAVYEDATSTGDSNTPSTGDGDVFTDLVGYDWAKDYIYTLKDEGIISGTSATTFSPANNIKRGDFILILVRMMSIDASFDTNFADVPESSYYYDAIGKAKAAGIAKGSGENFMPENSITRQDLITLAYRAFLEAGYIEEVSDTSSLDIFADKAQISDYALSAMASMVSAGIIKGNDSMVNPLGNATRAEVAVMCARLAELMK